MSSSFRSPLTPDDLRGTHLEGLDPQALKARRMTAVYVYEAPVRLWHWISALCIVVLCVTGYLIGSPLESLSGEASAHYQMGIIRFLHFAAAYIFAVGYAARFLWTFVGNVYARELFIVPVWRRSFWGDLWQGIRVNLFLEVHPKKVVGHNPLARMALFVFFVLGGLFMILTGFALYSEGEGLGSWQSAVFGWLLPLLGGSLATHLWHHLGMWLLIVFVMIHIYSVVREDLLSRQTMISSIINGYRAFRDDKPE